jgi:hypothetical protein
MTQLTAAMLQPLHLLLQPWAVPVALCLVAWYVVPVPSAATLCVIIRRSGSCASTVSGVVLRAYVILVGIYLVAPQKRYLAELTSCAGAIIFFVAVMPTMAAVLLLTVLSPPYPATCPRRQGGQ